MMMNIAGFTLVNWINYGLSFLGGSVAWRFPLAFQFVFIFILYATVPWLPESPRSVRLLILKGISNRTQTLTGYRWLTAHGREAEALEVICCLEAKPADDAYVTTLHDEIAYSISYERQNAVRWRDIFLRRKHPNDTKTIRRLLLGAGTQFMQQFEGINIMSYYLPTVLINYVGLSNEMARLLTACNATSYLIISCLFVPLIERWGRRSLMLFSTFGQFLAFLIITILLRFAEGVMEDLLSRQPLLLSSSSTISHSVRACLVFPGSIRLRSARFRCGRRELRWRQRPTGMNFPRHLAMLVHLLILLQDHQLRHC